VSCLLGQLNGVLVLRSWICQWSTGLEICTLLIRWRILHWSFNGIGDRDISFKGINFSFLRMGNTRQCMGTFSQQTLVGMVTDLRSRGCVSHSLRRSVTVSHWQSICQSVTVSHSFSLVSQSNSHSRSVSQSLTVDLSVSHCFSLL